MKQRCQNPKSPLRKWYLDKGVTVDPSWESFEQFYLDMGKAPTGSYLDRIDNSRGYEPGNVRWATKRQSMVNRTWKQTKYPTGIRRNRAGNYAARITIYGKEYTTGTYSTIEHAMAERKIWETMYAE